MYARIIPLLRTPAGVDVFDYRIPAGLTVARGELVRIPFRGKQHVGIVASMMKESAFANRASELTDHYGEIVFPEIFLDFIDWLAKEHFVSKPAALKSCLRQLPKKPGLIHLIHGSKRKGKIETFWKTGASEQLIQSVVKTKGRRLVLSPWKQRALDFQEQLPGSHALLSDLSMGEYFKTWTNFLSDPNGILITTRVGAWLSPLVDHLFIDEPENDDHKQDDLSPRFDARRIALWAHSRANVSVSSFGLTPPIHVNASAPDIPVRFELVIHHPKGRSLIPMIESETLQRIRDHEGPVVVIHPIIGMRSRVICRDCGWQAMCDHCDFPLSEEASTYVCRLCKKTAEPVGACPHCGSVDLGKSIPGIDVLKQKTAEQEPDLVIEWRAVSIADLEQPFTPRSFVVVTMGSMLGTGGAEDIRRNERLVIAFRRLAERVHRSDSTLLIQSSEQFAGDWESWLTDRGFSAFRQSELKERKLFAYPPVHTLIKVIIQGDADLGEKWRQKHERELSAFDVQGPFPVAYLPDSREPRVIFHLRPIEGVKRERIISLLTPLADSAIIDLDPIAFFR